jgi:hypothetical protein
MRKQYPVSIIAGLLAVFACILAPTASPAPGENPANTPDATAEPPGATPEPSATATAAPTIPAGFFPIAAGDPSRPNNATLLGGTENGTWVDAAAAAARLSGGETYYLFSPTGSIGTATGTNPTREIICDRYYFEWTPAPAPGEVIGLGGSWNALPRVPEQLSTDDEAYRNVVRDWWTAQGYAGADIRLTRVLRVDLDGDGTLEELIAATRMSEATGHDVAAGDYSVVLLHKQTAPQTLLLAGEYYPDPRSLAFPKTYSLSSAADLNGDGKMEVVLSVRRWEGGGHLVYAFDGAAAVRVFDSLCAL